LVFGCITTKGFKRHNSTVKLLIHLIQIRKTKMLFLSDIFNTR